MYQYRVFIKDCLDINGMPIANEICTSFDFSRDLLTSTTSNFYLLNMPSNIKNGDILGLVDPYGTIIYTGVIDAIDDNIQCRQILSIFDDEWLWHDPSQSTIEGKISSILNTDFINSKDVLLKEKFPFTVNVQSSTNGTFESQEMPYVTNFESFLTELYDMYGVIVDVNIPFSGQATINIKQATHVSVKIGNNALVIQNMTPTTEIFETNKLVIYDKEGTTLRGTYYGTENGITTDVNDPLRLPIIKTKYIFNSDDPLEDIKQENLQDEMFNHKISFDLILKGNLYNFYDWELGMPLEIFFNLGYFSTLFTGFSMSKEQNLDIASVNITCGKVRNKLTELLNGY